VQTSDDFLWRLRGHDGAVPLQGFEAGQAASATVGMSGAAALRLELVMPSGRMRPARICGMPVSIVAAMTVM
jgi:hypothetical protein